MRTRWSGGSISVQLRGGAKRRRIAIDAIRDLVDGANIEDIIVRHQKGAVVLPHEINDPERGEWLSWRLNPVEHEHGVELELSEKAVRILPGDTPFTEAERELICNSAEQAIDEAHKLLDEIVEVNAELQPEVADFAVTVAPL